MKMKIIQEESYNGENGTTVSLTLEGGSPAQGVHWESLDLNTGTWVAQSSVLHTSPYRHIVTTPRGRAGLLVYQAVWNKGREVTVIQYNNRRSWWNRIFR